eukprot:TRINITY_DN14939_c0_g1_i1.p1 TRINITY_DN14939_c0_g1~~TRINITY_DN14939_c0_g1_i1.p1  ORF type:complete len:108 (-),score=14.06 TRINITY_DN14939_c0_g1_i1:276-599(-)
MQLLARLLLGTCVVPLAALSHLAADAGRADLMLQLTSRRSMRSTAGYKLHRRAQKSHAWSKSCRHLPMLQRPACERQVDIKLLQETHWVLTDPKAARSAVTVKLDHD